MTWPPSALPVNNVGVHGDLRSWAQDVEAEITTLRTGCGARAYQSVSQSVPNATTTAVNLQSEDFDTDGFHDAGTPTRMTIPVGKGGLYAIVGQVGVPAATGDLHAILRKNGATVLTETLMAGSGSHSTFVLTSTIENLAAGDYVELCLYQNTTSARSLPADRTVTFLALERIAGGVVEDEAVTQYDQIVTSQTTTSTSFTDLTSIGPSVMVTVGSSGILDVDIGCFTASSGGADGFMGFVLSGANTRAVNGTTDILRLAAGSGGQNASRTVRLTGLTPGSTTVTAKYATSNGATTQTFGSRTIKATPR